MTVCPLPSTVSPPVTGPRLSFANWQTLSMLAIPVAIALTLFLLQQQWDINLFSAEGFETAVTRVGQWGPLLYMLLLMVSVVVSQIPGAGLAIAAGAVWGPLAAGIYTIMGGFLGALIAYSLGKAIGPSLLKALTGKSITFSKDRGERYLGGLIFLMRLVPVFSFDLISYGAGITKLSLPIYASATLLGMIPSTFLLTYLGGAFHLGSGAIVGILGGLIAGLVLLPWGIRRHNWLDLKSVVQID